MIDQIVMPIYVKAENKDEFVIGNHFTDRSKLSLFDMSVFFSFNEGKTLQSDIERFF